MKNNTRYSCSVVDDIEELQEIFSDFSIDICEIKYPHITKYALFIYFNDRFEYSTTDVLSMDRDYTTIKELYEDVKKWYDEEGKEILNKFKDIKYPDNNTENIRAYFMENRKLGKELWGSVDKYFKTKYNNWVWDNEPCFWIRTL